MGQHAKLKLNKEDVIKAFRESRGILSIAAAKLNVTRVTVYKFLERFKEVKEIYEQERESLLDFCEARLFNFIKDEEMDIKERNKAIYFILDRLGRKRGYGINHKEEEKENTVNPVVIVDYQKE